ncbi:PREDICTED: uncharacterized protein LOC106818062 [Priapulus caudatus]|uniref:Uncharacterized protein LOC106818062 n=1 Tax=Priapulus caudatus TaxID=37621 RepID=A0ABM1F1F2_PRICU|nr:PREDICTED: uncharacterized protein LOC106818062 [Priapulus caudatus]
MYPMLRLPEDVSDDSAVSSMGSSPGSSPTQGRLDNENVSLSECSVSLGESRDSYNGEAVRNAPNGGATGGMSLMPGYESESKFAPDKFLAHGAVGASVKDLGRHIAHNHTYQVPQGGWPQQPRARPAGRGR